MTRTRAVRRPATRARQGLGHPAAALTLALTLAATGCSGATSDPPPPDVPSGGGGRAVPTSAPSPSAAPLSDGGTPEFHGSLPMALQPAEEIYVQPTCAPDLSGQRACWGENVTPVRPAGAASPATLTDATMRIDDRGLDWSVDLTFADDTPSRAARSVAGVGEAGRLVVLDGERRPVRTVAAGAVDAQGVSIGGLDKDEAWDLVLELGDL